MYPRRFMAMALDPGATLRARRFTVDRWQTDVLLSRERQLLLNCCRQAGKSTVVSALALHTALFQPTSLTLILSPGQRQSSETFKKVIEGYSAIGRPLKADYETQLHIELALRLDAVNFFDCRIPHACAGHARRFPVRGQPAVSVAPGVAPERPGHTGRLRATA